MRNFKKISAIFLIVAMVFSLVTVNVFATDEDITIDLEVNKVKVGQGQSFELTIFYTWNKGTTEQTQIEVGNSGCTVAYTGDFTVEDLSDSTMLYDKNGSSKTQLDPEYKEIPLGGQGAKLSSTKTAVAKFRLTASETATIAPITLSLPVADFAFSMADGTPMTAKAGTIPTVEIAKVDKVTSIGTIAAQSADLGATKAEIAEQLKSVTVKGTNTAGEVTLKTKDWDSDTFVADKKGTYTFKGVAYSEDEFAPIDSTVSTVVTVDVTINGIALTNEMVTSKYSDITVQQVEDATANMTAAEILAKATGDAYTKATISKNGKFIEEDATVAWSTEGTLDLKTVSDVEANTNVVVVTGIVTPNSSGNYTGTTTVTIKAYVVPANISGGSFELTDSTFVPNTKPAVKVTVPAAEVAKLKLTEEDGSEAARKVVASIADKSEGAAADAIAIADDAEFTDEEIGKARADVLAAGEDAEKLAALAPYTKTVTFSKTLSDLGYDYSEDTKKAFTVSVTVGGTTLLTKDGKTSVSGTVVKPSSGGSSGGIGINKGDTTKTYAVTVVETKNGTATVSPENAAAGTTVTVKPEPAEGYKVKSVTAVKADGTNVPVDEKAYTFTMPSSAVKVTVEFEEGTPDEPGVDPTPADGKFADVADDFWAAKDIYTLKDAGIIGGKSETEFDPEGDVTRAEFAKMVVGLFGYKATSGAVEFTDCGADDWFTEFVAAGVEAGVIKGVSDTEFAPNATITREDACTILGRALNKVAQSNELKFTDADKVAEYAAPYVALLSELGYVNGYEDGSFAPTNNITRAEAAKIIAGIYNANKSDETVTDDKTEAETDADANTDANVEENVDEKAEENAEAPVEETTEDNAEESVDTIDVAPEK